MKSYKELATATSEERFLEILTFATTGVKNIAVLETLNVALHGNQTKEVMSLKETAIISELCCKGFVSEKQSECLIELANCE